MTNSDSAGTPRTIQHTPAKIPRVQGSKGVPENPHCLPVFFSKLRTPHSRAQPPSGAGASSTTGNLKFKAEGTLKAPGFDYFVSCLWIGHIPNLFYLDLNKG